MTTLLYQSDIAISKLGLLLLMAANSLARQKKFGTNLKLKKGFIMRSATYNEFGKPTEVLSLGDRPIPEPKANEVRVKTILASIHNHDLLTIRGQWL